MKKIIALILFGWALLCLSSMSFAQQAFTRSLRLGIGHFYPPFIYNNSAGFDSALATALCKQIGANCVFYNMPLNQMLQSLQHSNVDAIIGAVSITPERQKRFLFTKPYLISTVSFLGLSETKYPQTLDNLSIGVIASSTFDTYLNALAALNVRIKTATSYGDLLTDLANKKIDLILLDTPVGHYWVTQSHGSLKIIGSPFQINFDQGFGIAVNKQNRMLANLLNQGLASLITNGTYQRLIQLYFPDQPPMVVIPPWIRALTS